MKPALDPQTKITKAYSELCNGYHPSPYVNTEWPMKDGMFQQYSGFEDDSPCSTGTLNSIVIL